MRRVRGDGNCFYRAFLFSLLEHLLEQLQTSKSTATAQAEVDRLSATVTGSRETLTSLGYDEFAFESFQEAMSDTLTELPSKTQQQLEAEFQAEDGVSMHLVWFCRLLTSANLKLNADRYVAVEAILLARFNMRLLKLITGNL